MQEIERKFLVDISKWQPGDKGTKIMQGYLSVDPKRVVRIRIAGNAGFLTIKGISKGISRAEYEYEIPVSEAEALMKLCMENPIVKTRYTEKRNNVLWEIDVFEGVNKGLVLAEVELEHENQVVSLPNWIKEEVSEDFRYFNSWLSQNPFSDW